MAGDGPVIMGPAGQRLNNSGVVADVWEMVFCEDRQVIADGDRKGPVTLAPRSRRSGSEVNFFGGDVALLGFRGQCSDALYLTGLCVAGSCPRIHSR
jgi:hypothetical protein